MLETVSPIHVMKSHLLVPVPLLGILIATSGCNEFGSAEKERAQRDADQIAALEAKLKEAEREIKVTQTKLALADAEVGKLKAKQAETEKGIAPSSKELQGLDSKDDAVARQSVQIWAEK